MLDPTGEPENFSDHIDLANLAASRNPPFLSGSILLDGVPRLPEENSVSLQSYQQVQTECNKLHRRIESQSQHISQLERDMVKWKNKAQAAHQKIVPFFASFASHIASFILLHNKIQEWKGPPLDTVLSVLDRHLPSCHTVASSTKILFGNFARHGLIFCCHRSDQLFSTNCGGIGSGKAPDRKDREFTQFSPRVPYQAQTGTTPKHTKQSHNTLAAPITSGDSGGPTVTR